MDKVTGVEISENLVRQARKNLQRLKAKNTEILCCNAIDLPSELLDETTLFYFYNPFPKEIFDQVFHAIEQSIRVSRPRTAILIYFNPVCEGIITQSPVFVRKVDYSNKISLAKTSVFYMGEGS